MGILIVIVFLALSSWVLVALFRRLRRQRATSGWWVAFGVLVACGVAPPMTNGATSPNQQIQGTDLRLSLSFTSLA